MSYGLAQARYASDAAETVSASRLLTMLYDRLLSDLAVGEQALEADDPATAGERIGRAQEILLELHSTLDTRIWPEGEPLARLYLWMTGELMKARLHRAPRRVAECRELLVPLRDAWYAASAAEAEAGNAAAAVQGRAAGEGQRAASVPGAA
jgi:flagellar secretion chaperone FliS